jgi:sugar O-acyltransferase (sialic acid O-acetyltransferase NeuD family)
MIIVGAKGFAKEVLEILYQLNQVREVVFYDDQTPNLPDRLFNEFPIIRSSNQVEKYFKDTSNQFTIGIGNPVLRKQVYEKFKALGGELTSVISPFACIGHYAVGISEGCNIMTNVILTSDIRIGKGSLLNLNCTIGHDSDIGDFVEMAPAVHVSGNCKIGSFTNIGTNATILPKVRVGHNVIIGAGAVVTKDVPDNCLVVGVPGKIVKELPKLTFTYE